MPQRQMLKPSANHPITIEPLKKTVTVTVAGKTIVSTDGALLLKEGSYPPAIYVPRKDTHMELLERTDHSSYCPYKGEASYYSIPAGGSRSKNAVWTYEAPYDSVSPIKNYLAFYPDRVDEIAQR